MTEQELLEIKAEVENSAIPKPSQEKIIKACGKQVAKKAIIQPTKPGFAVRECPVCGSCGFGNYCEECGQRLEE